MLPESTQTFKDVDFLAFANEELDLGVVPHVLSFHEDYLMLTQTVPLQANVIRYEIPSRAMGNKIREVQYEDGTGVVYEMTRIFIEDLPYFQTGSMGSNGIRAFYMEGNEIVLPTLNNSLTFTGNLKISYYMRCSELVAESRVAKVTNIDLTTGVITLDSWPTNFSSSPLIDITSCKSPHKISAFDLQPTAYGDLNNPQITFSVSDLPLHLRIGDIISNAEETIIPQIPAELHSMLSQRVALRCLEALGDTQGLQNAMVKLQEMEAKAGSIIDDRVEGAPFKISPKHSFLRKSRIYLRR